MTNAKSKPNVPDRQKTDVMTQVKPQMKHEKLNQFLTGIVTSMVSFAVLAGSRVTASIVYTPAVATTTPVPALSDTALIALAVLLPVIMMRAAREPRGGSFLKIFLPGVVLAVSGMAGFSIIKDAYSVVYALQNTLLLSNPAGGTTSAGGLYIVAAPNYMYDKVLNSSGVSQQINSITVSPSPTYFTVDPSVAGAGITPRCLPGMTLITGGTCYIAFGTG